MTRLEHIGIAVNDPIPVQNLLSGLLGLCSYKVESVSTENVHTHFIGAGGVKLELLDTEIPDSTIGRFLQRHGEGFHHLAFEVQDIDEVFGRAVKMGLTPINPEPKAGADGKRIFFLHPRETHGILIEICQVDRFSGLQSTVKMPHGEVAAFEAGQSDAVSLLLLHNAGSSTDSDFRNLMALLEPSAHLVAFDAPGHGASREWMNSNHFLRAADKHARAVLDAFGIERAVVAGLGVGAAAASALAVTYPERVRALILLNPNLLQSREDVESAREEILAACDKTMPALASALVSTLDEAAEASVPLNRLLELTCPILVCCDTPTALPGTLRLHRAIGGSELAVIPKSRDDYALGKIIAEFVGDASE